jgi:hypothetical protein
MKRDSYVIRNVSKYDINLGDLRYKIPAGQSRDLLSKTARLEWEAIDHSRKHGSIAVRLGKTLVEITRVVKATPPLMKMADSSVISFPKRVKSSITLEVGDPDKEVQELTMVEDEEFLKQLDEEFLLNEGKAPLVMGEDEEE